MSDHDATSAASVVLHVTADPALKADFAREISNQTTFEVSSASSVNEALDTLRERDGISCIVSDHDLPDVDGISFLETVRTQNPDLPFILFTSEGSERMASRAIHARVTDYLIKEQVRDQWATLATLIAQAITFHRTQSPLRDPESRAKVILEAAVDAMAIVHDGAFVYTNENALDLFGVDDRQTLRDIAPLDLISPETRDLTRDTLAAIRAGEKHVHRLEQEIVGKDGLVTPIELTAAGIDWQTQPSILLICRDISGRKDRARELDRQNMYLKTIAEIISHDLQNPLIAAQGRLRLAQQECESEHLKAIEEVFERMASIHEGTTTLARLGDTITHMEPISLTALIHHSWRTVDTSNMTLDVIDELTIRGAPDRLHRVFEHLFRNAVEHSGDDVTVRVGQIGKRGIYVEDDGPGIPKSERDRVVEPGQTSAIDGTGLGLAIVTRLATAHGWQVALTEGTDGGARIEFTDVEFVS